MRGFFFRGSASRKRGGKARLRVAMRRRGGGGVRRRGLGALAPLAVFNSLGDARGGAPGHGAGRGVVCGIEKQSEEEGEVSAARPDRAGGGREVEKAARVAPRPGRLGLYGQANKRIRWMPRR